MRAVIGALCLFLLFFGCVQPSTNTGAASRAATACISLCKAELAKGTDLSKGPCLSNGIVPDWVCDVAHSPRETVDNEPANQCSAYREGKAHHFVEVDTNCEAITVY